MKIFVSTTWNGIQSSDLCETLFLMNDLECDGFELGSTHLPIVDHSFICKYTYGRELITHNYFPSTTDNLIINLASLDEPTRNKSIQFCRSAIKFASEIGASHYTVHPGFLKTPVLAKSSTQNFDFKFHPIQQDYEKSYQAMLKSITYLLECSLDYGVNLLIETEGSVTTPNVCLLETPSEIRRLFEYFPSGLNLNFNLAHSRFSSTINKFCLLEFIHEFHEKIIFVEISDNDGSADQHRPLNANSFALQYLKVLKGKNLILEFRNSKIEDIRNSITIIKRELQ